MPVIDTRPIPALSPDGSRVFAVDLDGSIRRWAIGSKESVGASTNQRSTSINCLTLSPRGALLGFSHGNYVTVWDAATMEQLAQVEMVEPQSYVLFRDEETLITVGPTSFRIWNWRTNSVLVGSVDPHDVLRLASSSDGRRIAVISPTTVSIWDSDLKSEIGRLPPGDYQAVAFSPDGRRIVSVGAKEDAVRIWDAERLLPLLTLQDIDGHLGGVAFTAAGQIVAGRSGGGLTIWDTQIRRR